MLLILFLKETKCLFRHYVDIGEGEGLVNADTGTKKPPSLEASCEQSGLIANKKKKETPKTRYGKVDLNHTKADSN